MHIKHVHACYYIKSTKKSDVHPPPLLWDGTENYMLFEFTGEPNKMKNLPSLIKGIQYANVLK